MNKPSLSILHTSDVHLDNNIGGPGEESHAQLGFIRVIDRALELEVDLFLLAGDLFDDNRVNESCFEFVNTQLARLTCPVVMVAGNHDCLTDHSVYHRYDPTGAGDHVRFIRDEPGATTEFPELGLTVWGRGIVDHHTDNQPLEYVPPRNSQHWYVGVTHGYYAEQAIMCSSLITHAEIESSGLDYLALGHFHAYQLIEAGNTVAAYPGSPNRDLHNQELTAAHIRLCPDDGVRINRVLLIE